MFSFFFLFCWMSFIRTSSRITSSSSSCLSQNFLILKLVSLAPSYFYVQAHNRMLRKEERDSGERVRKCIPGTPTMLHHVSLLTHRQYHQYDVDPHTVAHNQRCLHLQHHHHNGHTPKLWSKHTFSNSSPKAGDNSSRFNAIKRSTMPIIFWLYWQH